MNKIIIIIKKKLLLLLLLLLSCGCYSCRCKLRIVDSFGTEAQFNYNLFKENIPGGSMGAYGRHNLDLRQYQTMFREYLFDKP